MHPDITKAKQQVRRYETFWNKHEEALTKTEASPMFGPTDGFVILGNKLAEAGEMFGKFGWIRKVGYRDFNWQKEFDGMQLTICSAESMEDNVPVPPQAFPLMLADVVEEATP